MLQFLQGADMYAFSNQVMADNGQTLATFSSHWAAVAAMLRVGDPDYKSLRGDSIKDLETEKYLAKRLAG